MNYEVCEEHREECQYFCSCSMFICNGCIKTHKEHENFQLRNREHIEQHFLEEFDRMNKYVNLIKSPFDSHLLDTSIINRHKENFNKLISSYQEEASKIFSEVGKIIDYEKPHEISQEEMSKFLAMNVSEALNKIVVRTFDTLGEMEKRVKENLPSFIREYDSLLKKYFSFNCEIKEEQEEIGGSQIEINLSRSMGELNLNIEASNFSKEHFNIEDTTKIVQTENSTRFHKEPIKLKTNRVLNLKPQNFKFSPSSEELITNTCIDCNKPYKVNRSDFHWKVRCYPCYMKSPKKNK